MQTDRNALLSFIFGAVWPAVVIVLFLSIGLNAFFLTVDRFRQVHITDMSSSASSISTDVPMGNGGDTFARAPQAFGKVWRGFPVRSQKSVASVAIGPVKSYEFGPDVLPTLPSALTLYRDQGIDVDPTFITGILSRFGAPFATDSTQYFARVISLKSGDTTRDITLDMDRRLLTVTVKNATPAPAGITRADDAEVIALAKQFASSLGVDLTGLGAPVVTERTDAGSASPKTIVSWNATFAGYPLFDMSMNPVPALEVQVGRVSHRAITAWINLLRPELLTHSEYPAASRDLVSDRLISGGFLPVEKTLPGKAAAVTYTSSELGYVVQPADADYPLYVVPVVRASWMAPLTCKGCVPQQMSTFVPALDTKTFSWSPETRPPAEPLKDLPDTSGETPEPAMSSSVMSAMSSSKK